ncbi:MAG TPA: hypothetical protein VFG87_21775 [Amycolatopsis sp.]|nr:hypothetical protein [Amycolatopsis sp.]
MKLDPPTRRNVVRSLDFTPLTTVLVIRTSPWYLLLAPGAGRRGTAPDTLCWTMKPYDQVVDNKLNG